MKSTITLFLLSLIAIAANANPVMRAPLLSKPPIKIVFKIPKLTGKPGQVSVEGISNFGNGGGLAEMRLIYLHQNLDRFLQICLSKDNQCHISDQTKAEWEKLVSRQAADSANYVISFLPKIDNDFGYLVNGQQLQISSQMLYLDMETPKQFGQLLAFIISVRQQIAGSVFSFEDNLKTASDVFTVLKVNEASYKADGIPSLLRLSQLKVSDGNVTEMLYSLEDKEKTIDITPMIVTALPCGNIADWRLSQWSSGIDKTSYFYGYASGICDGVAMQRRIVIDLELSKTYLINADKINVNFFAN